MTLSEIIKETTKMRDEAAIQVRKFKDADCDDEFAQLNYYNGQQVSLNQVLSWFSKLMPENKTI